MRRWVFPLVAFAALGGLIAWRLQSKRAEAAAQTRMRQMRMSAPPVVSVAPASVRDVVHAFEAVGSVQAPLNVNITPKVTGQIDYLQVHEGDRVQRGEVLVRIDPTETQAQLRQQESALAEARYRLAQAELTRDPTNVLVTTQISQQEAALTSARANYNQTAQNYNSQVAAANAAVTAAGGQLNSATAAVANARAGIDSANANLANAQATFNRTSNLYKQGFVAAQDVDNARTAVSVQKAAVEVAQGQLNSAQAQRDSAAANVGSAREQLAITKTKGQADIKSARAVVDQAQAALKYARANRAQTPAYEQNLAALSAAVAANLAAVNAARAQLSYTTLTSPIDGFVTGRFMDPGAMASPSQPILAVQEIRQVWVSVPIPEEVYRRVALGQAADVSLDALPGRTSVGRVTQLNPSADPLSRQFTARITLDNPRGELKPGMFARVGLVTERVKGAVVVPREAVQQGPNGAAVTVIDEGGLEHRRPVATGVADAPGIAITGGLQPGEHVVTLSQMPLKDGQKVRVAGQSARGAANAGRRSWQR